VLARRQPFVASLTWATALAVIAWPLHKRFARYLRTPWLAATLSCLVVFIAIGIPMTMLVPRIVAEAAGALDLIRDWIASGEATRLLESQAWLTPAYEWAQPTSRPARSSSARATCSPASARSRCSPRSTVCCS
jgi:predicted PurR-regulated permease PerM